MSKSATLKQAHIQQVLWLGDERAIEILMDLLDDEDRFVRFLALSLLDGLEFGRRFMAPTSELPRQASDYRARRNDRELRRTMVRNLQADQRPAHGPPTDERNPG